MSVCHEPHPTTIHLLCEKDTGHTGQHRAHSSPDAFHVWNDADAPDMVNKPPHYSIGIEPIDAIESWDLGFCLGNTVKYIARAEHKGTPLQDLQKARWYLDREIASLEKGIKRETVLEAPDGPRKPREPETS